MSQASTDNPEPADFPTEGRLLGIDFGTKRLGLAVSSPDQQYAGPLENYTCRSPALDLKHLAEVITEYRIHGLVVGLPVHMSGDEGGQAREARVFGERLAAHTGLPLRYWDERFTSLRAEEVLQEAGLSKKKRQQRRDKLAALFMLQSFLDAPDRERPPESM